MSIHQVAAINVGLQEIAGKRCRIGGIFRASDFPAVVFCKLQESSCGASNVQQMALLAAFFYAFQPPVPHLQTLFLLIPNPISIVTLVIMRRQIRQIRNGIYKNQPAMKTFQHRKWFFVILNDPELFLCAEIALWGVWLHGLFHPRSPS